MFLLRGAVFALFFASGLLTGCETVTTQSQKALVMLGLGQDTAQKSSARSPRQRPARNAPQRESRTAQKTSSEPTPQPMAANDDSAIIITKTDTGKTRQVPKKDLKNVVKPEFRVEAPVDVQKRVGGVTRNILSDDRFLYLDFPQHFAVYDHNLNFLARRKVAFPVREAKHFTRDGKIYIYIKEENHVLEIMELDVKEDPDKKITVSLKDVMSFDVGGDFFWMNGKEFVVLLDHQVQILDFTNFNDIRIAHEISLGQVSDVLEKSKLLFLSRNGYLDAFDRAKKKHVLSVKIGRDFRFGATQDKQVMLSFVNEQNHLKGYLTITLPDDPVEPIRFGETRMLAKPLKNYHIDLKGGFIIGRESNEKKSPLRLYSIAHDRYLRGELSVQTDLATWSLQQGKLHLVTPQAISINTITPKPEVIEKSKALALYLNRQKSGPQPLAQIGSSKILEDEYTITPDKTIEFMANARKVFLLDENHLVVIENKAGDNTNQILATTDFMNEDFVLNEPRHKEDLPYDSFKSTDFGLLAYNHDRQKIDFLDVNFTQISTLPITVKDLVSWTVFSTAEGEILVTSSKNPFTQVVAAPAAAKDKKTAPVKSPAKTGPQPALNYTVEFYQMKSPAEVNLIRQIPFAEKPFVFINKSLDLMVLTGSNLETHSLDFAKNFEPTEFDKMKFYETHDIIDAKISPMADRFYMLIRHEERHKILVQSSSNPTQHVLLRDFEILPEHFAGSTFSKGGQLYILPTLEGTLFYDMSDLTDKDEDARIMANWPEPSWWVDVARGGRYMCVALGPKGVYCGELLFY